MIVLRTLISFFEKNNWIFYVIAIILVFPALLINLGLFPLTSDEHIRGLVALEMIINDDYVTPTIYGEYYLKKPPLFNWVLLAFAWIFGNFNEFTLRLPTVIATIFFAITIFYFVRKHYNNQFAFVNAIAFVTCGRMLFWDTQLALIDVTFSWVIYMNFMIIYHLFHKGKFLQLFIISYILTAIGYMFKGLPAIVFEAVTLLVFFAFHRRFIKLLTWKHFAGILVFIIIVGTYYLIFLSSYPSDFENAFYTLFEQTTRRTVIRFGWERTIHHFIRFPFDMFYHFLPWSILIISVLNFKLFGKFFTNKSGLVYSIMLIVVLTCYFIFYQTWPHYTIILIPVFIILFLQLYRKAKGNDLFINELTQIRYSFIASFIILPLIIISFFIQPETAFFKFIQYTVSALIFLLIFFSARFLFRYNDIIKEPFVKFCAVIFIANIIVYWTSPEVHPRYILMLTPLIFLVFLHFYFKQREKEKFQSKAIDTVFFILSFITALGSLSLPFLKETKELQNIILKSIIIFIGLGFFTFLFYKLKSYRLIILGIILLILRIGFNWSVLESRGKYAHEIESREGAIKTGKLTKDKDLFIYKDSWVDDFSGFYITRERMKILKRKHENFSSGDLYLVDERYIEDTNFTSLYEYRIVWEKKRLDLIKIDEKN